jgi:hypothetical protein
VKVVPAGAKAASNVAAVSSAGWYARHQERNKALKEVFSESRYMLEATTSSTAAAVTVATGFTLGVVTAATGIVGGVAFIYVALPAAGSGDAAGAVLTGGGLIAASGVMAGMKTNDAGKERAKEMLEEGVGQAAFYRYVRFLPSAVRLVALDNTAPPTVQVGEVNEAPFFTPKAIAGSPRVYGYAGAATLGAGPLPKAKTVVRHWPLAGETIFAFNPKPMTGTEAARACDKLPLDPGYGRWYLPGPTFVHYAVKAGIKDGGADNLLPKEIATTYRIWAYAPLPLCSSITMTDNDDPQRTSCEQMLPVLCEATLDAALKSSP